MGEFTGRPAGAGGPDYPEYPEYPEHPQDGRRASGALSDAEAERLLNGPWALRHRSGSPADDAGVQNGERQLRPSAPTDLPDFEGSAVAGNPSRMKYSAGWDGADDPSGHAGARGSKGVHRAQGVHGARAVEDPATAGDAWRPDTVVGTPDSGGEMTVSSVDFPIDLTSPDAQAVARLLAAASAPPRPHELRGYEAARRAFERAGATPVRRGATLPLRRMIGVKMAAVAGALTVTGVAVAAEADVLPSPLQRVAHQVLGGVGVPDSDPDPTVAGPPSDASSSSSAHPETPRPSGSAPGGTTSGGALVPGTPTGTLSAGAPGSSTKAGADGDVLALCRAFVAHSEGGDGGQLSGHDRQRLAALAGGDDKIADYCARLLATAPPAQPSGTADAKTTPSPSKDHKPTGTAGPSTEPGNPTPDDGGGGNGHGHSTSPNAAVLPPSTGVTHASRR